MKTIIMVIVLLLLILVFSCCAIQKDNKYTEIFKEVYMKHQEYKYTSEEFRLKAEQQMIKQYIEKELLPDGSAEKYKLWRAVNYPNQPKAPAVGEKSNQV